MNYNCPRCNYEFELDSVPSKGWVCEFCAEELGIKDEENIFAQSPINDLEERRLEEDFDGKIENKIQKRFYDKMLVPLRNYEFELDSGEIENKIEAERKANAKV